ncbi:MAG: FAD-dependent monooxygenase [Pseudomonadota bacterium]
MTKSIGIAGCGIAGLATAILLKQSNHSVTVFDEFETPEPVGSGSVIQPVGQTVLAACGVLDQAVKDGNPKQRMIGCQFGMERAILDVAYDPKKHIRFGLAVHRSTLFSALYKRACALGVEINHSAKVISI